MYWYITHFEYHVDDEAGLLTLASMVMVVLSLFLSSRHSTLLGYDGYQMAVLHFTKVLISGLISKPPIREI